ncbi:MAG: hypothetical protein IJ794_11925 [Lachnospiraceae bacterium]|nr:hypothetical protein [Lachnospiraceae bacterium]
MKKGIRLMALVVALSLMVSGSVFAAETHQHSEAEGIESISYNPGDITSYRCLKTSCRAYLFYKYALGTCVYCDSATHAYKCSHCDEWYCICEGGHYNPVYGR